MKRLLLVLVLLVACSSGDVPGVTSNGGGTPNDGDCPEKDAMIATQGVAEDPTGPGGAKITNSELRAIRETIQAVPSDC